MATPMPEPASGLVAWFDQNGHPYAVFHKDPNDDVVRRDPDDCWFNADQHDSDDTAGKTWDELLDEMDGLDGPYRLEISR